MKHVIIALFVCLSAWGQCGKMAQNPVTGKLDCIGSGGALVQNASGFTAASSTTVSVDTTAMNLTGTTMKSAVVGCKTPTGPLASTWTCNAAVPCPVDGTAITAVNFTYAATANVSCAVDVGGSVGPPGTAGTNGTNGAAGATGATGSATATSGIDFTQVATPENPASGHNKLYSKSDNKFYVLQSDGTETAVGSGSDNMPDPTGHENHVFAANATPTGVYKSFEAGPSGGAKLAHTDTAIEVDIETAVVPTKADANTWSGLNSFPGLILIPGAAPGSPAEGQMWYDSSLHKFRCKTNGAAGDCGGAGGGSIATTASILKGGNDGTAVAAVAGTDYAAAPTGAAAMLKRDGSGGFSAATAGVDYVPATSGSAIQKASSGILADATKDTAGAGTGDYYGPGSQILAADMPSLAGGNYSYWTNWANVEAAPSASTLVAQQTTDFILQTVVVNGRQTWGTIGVRSGTTPSANTVAHFALYDVTCANKLFESSQFAAATGANSNFKGTISPAYDVKPGVYLLAQWIGKGSVSVHFVGQSLSTTIATDNDALSASGLAAYYTSTGYSADHFPASCSPTPTTSGSLIRVVMGR